MEVEASPISEVEALVLRFKGLRITTGQKRKRESDEEEEPPPKRIKIDKALLLNISDRGTSQLQKSSFRKGHFRA